MTNLEIVLIVLVLLVGVGWASSVVLMARMYYAERGDRITAQTTLHQVQRAVNKITAREILANKPDTIDLQIRPMVEAAQELEMSGHEKRMKVMLQYMKKHPGADTQAIEESIERVLYELGPSESKVTDGR